MPIAILFMELLLEMNYLDRQLTIQRIDYHFRWFIRLLLALLLVIEQTGPEYYF